VLPAVFLDRDGVLNELIFNPKTGEYESPHSPQDLSIIDDVIPTLRRLVGADFELFLVSNQPSYAKGKTTLENIQEIHRRLDGHFRASGIVFTDYYYCYHHPRGVVPDYSGPCRCRKPEPYFLLRAAEMHDVDLRASWMVGDQDTDVECGQRAGCKTALVLNSRSAGKRGASRPNISDSTFSDVADLIIQCRNG